MGEGTARKPPLRRRRIIERPRLTRLLDESQGRIKLLIAPAGYGKTTLARQWLEGRQAAWYSATPASRDVAALASGIAHSMASVAPTAGGALQERLSMPVQGDPEPDVLAALLAAGMEDWPPLAWLVIDDYHVISGASSPESFISALVGSSDFNLFVLSRTRPAWVTARELLYGEMFELERRALAMTDDEAIQMLDGPPRLSRHLRDIAQGWPAVLALGHVADALPPRTDSSSRLHDFFAGEIYQRLDGESRLTLCELSLYDRNTRRHGVRALPTTLGQAVSDVAAESGFLVEFPDGTLDMHPLLRDFLAGQLETEWCEELPAVVRRVTEVLMTHESWDAAFEVASKYGQESLLTNLIACSMQTLLATGRTATLRQWVERAPQDAPDVQMAAAELAFREGRFHESEALARMSATSKTGEEAAQAHLIAGRAAHASSREREAATYFASAESLAESNSTRRRALLGAIGTAIELELPDARVLLESLGPADDLEPSERVILTSRKINLETRLSLPVSVDEARATWQILGRVSDPMLRATFRNVVGYSLASMGFADEALEITAELLRDADRYRLDFAVPYGLTNQALVYFLNRDYVLAEEVLEEAEHRARGAGDHTAYHIAWCVRTRLHNAQGAFDRSLSRPVPRQTGQTESLEAELLASYAVSFACLGEFAAAQQCIDRSRGKSQAVEIAVSASAAGAICELHRPGGNDRHALEHAHNALSVAATTGMIESFVSAYRACPELLVLLHQMPSAHADIRQVVTTAGDAPSMLMKTEGRYSILELSPREKEVLALLSEGLSNRDIGERLFISPVTVKVHVRHIFEKLGVSSRAEAALRAARLSRD